MLIITTSAKTLDLESKYSVNQTSLPVFLHTAQKIQAYLKQFNKAVLKDILKVSDELTQENYLRFQNWDSNHNSENSRPAIFTYKGDIFKQINPKKYDEEEQQYAQKSLRVLSGLYGILKAYDLMQPYRLEMHTRLALSGLPMALNQFWRIAVTENLNEDMAKYKHKYLLNLASEEYANAVDFDSIKGKVVKVDFKEKRDSKVEIIGILAKKARGMMIEYCIKHQIKEPKDLRKFKEGGYKFKEETKEGKLVFVR